MKNDLAWRIEGACLKAWPALQEEQIGGWTLRFAENLTRRANSINPLDENAEADSHIIEQCEAKYHAAAQPVIFRIPSLMSFDMQAQLLSKNYTPEGESLVMQAEIGNVFMASDSRVEIVPHPHDEWLAAMSGMQGHNAQTRVTYKKIVNKIAVSAAFASLRLDNKPVSVAYGTVHNGFFVFESVITDPAHRGQGHAKRMLGSLIDWAKTNGAEGICLQVQGDNVNAQRLYNDMGFRKLYEYLYFRAPVLN